MKKKIIIGNWKMYGGLPNIKSLCDLLNLGTCDFVGNLLDIVLCVPAPYFDYVRSNVHSNISIGAQNISQYNDGAFTGEISASMIKEFYCAYTLIGHSERRMLFGDNDNVIQKKIIQALNYNIVPIVCVGETLNQRLNNQSYDAVLKQITNIFYCSHNGIDNIILAYEPVWTIGTGVAATLTQIRDMHKFISFTVKNINEYFSKKIRIIYGGSLSPCNAMQIFALDNVDGGLVGNCSLSSKYFISIINKLLLN